MLNIISFDVKTALYGSLTISNGGTDLFIRENRWKINNSVPSSIVYLGSKTAGKNSKYK